MWITLTEADVLGRLSRPELTALTSAAKATSQTSEGILATAIEVVTRKVRGYVGGCSKNKLGDGNTIPDELTDAALALVRNHLFTRLPGMADLNDTIRQKETENATAELKDVARCLIAIVAPETAAPQQPAGPAIQLVSSRKRQATRTKTSGLL